MAHYTATLRDLIDPTANPGTYSRVNGSWQHDSNDTGFTLFDEDRKYPLIFDGSAAIGGYTLNPIISVPQYDGSTATFNFASATYRDYLNQKIIDHYFGYEIGFETPQMFKHYFNTKLREIMPYYNNKYYNIMIAIAQNVPFTYFERTDYNGKTLTNTDTVLTLTHGDAFTWDYRGSTTINGESVERTYNFDTPQNISSLNPDSPDHMSSAVTGKSQAANVQIASGFVDGSGNITQDFADAHATSKSKKAQDTQGTKGDASKNYTEYEGRYDTKHGFSAAQRMEISKYIGEQLGSMGNIDLEIINELRSCFMMIF